MPSIRLRATRGVNLHQTSLRCPSRIQQYDVSIKYMPGSDVKLADALSRVNPCNTGHIRGFNLSVHEVHMCYESLQLDADVLEHSAV